MGGARAARDTHRPPTDGYRPTSPGSIHSTARPTIQPDVDVRQSPKDKPPALGLGLRERLDRPSAVDASGYFQVLRRCLAAIGHQLVLHGLSVVESAKARTLHRRDV